MGYFISIIIFAAGLFLFSRMLKDAIPRWLILTGWVLKLVASILYIYIFTTYYGEGGRIQGDSLNFLEDGKVLHGVAHEKPLEYLKILTGISGNESHLSEDLLARTNIWDYGDNGDWINDNRLIIRINSVIFFFSFGNIYVHALVLSLLAYLGIIMFYKAFERYISHKKLFFAALIIFPSLLFWGSGITKETIMLLSIGMLFFGFEKLSSGKFALTNLALLAAGIFLALMNKPYAGLVIIPLLAIIPIGAYLSFRRRALVWFTGLVIASAVVLSYTPEKLNLVDKISYKQKDLVNLAKGGVFFVTDSSFCAFDFKYFDHFDTIGNNQIIVTTDSPGDYKLFGQKEFHPFTIPASKTPYEIYLVTAPSTSYFPSTQISYQGRRLITTIPEALLNTLVRPFPWDPGSPLKYLSFTQNFCFLGWIVFVLFNRRKLTPPETYRFYLLVVASLIILLVIAWTTPVFGAIARYKVPADFMLLTASFMLFKKSDT